jgi:hypothetical protein
VKGLKAFCSLSDYFGDARFAELNQKNSGLAALKQLLIFYAPPQLASVSQNSRISLAKTFQPYQFEFLQFFMRHNTR